MLIREIITEGRDALLYHGYSEPEHASTALASGLMAATSAQRFWADGRFRREDEHDYGDSYWMKGISFTRDIRFAMAWGWIVFGVNQSKLSQMVKVIPYNWGYHMTSDYFKIDPKKEREEFAIVKATPDNYKLSNGQLDVDRFLSKNEIEGHIKLAPILEEIWLHASLGSTKNDSSYFQNEDMKAKGYSIEDIIKNPKFKGYYVGGKHSETYKKWPANFPRDQLPTG